MGIPTLHAKILFYSTTLGVSFDRTLTLGRQNLYASKNDIRHYLSRFMNDDLVAGDEFKDNEYSEPLFKNLGANLIDSMDNSTYEGATVLHDLNEPIAEDMKNKYSAIVDGGTLEHVFNFPVAVKNCMQMLRVGGHFVGFTPANSQCGHGFYQFSPELFFRIFSPKNGFEVKLMAMHAGDGIKDSTDVYLVKDPDYVKTRIEFQGKKPLCLIVVAEKIKDTDLFSELPQQSDYDSIWSAKDSESRTSSTDNVSTLRTLYREKIPLNVRNTVYQIYYKIRYRRTNYRGFAKVHKEFVDKLDF
jgi:hypothetical protein